jgi:hypothetical protein
MAALPPTRSRPRWLALGVLAVFGAGLLVWQLGGDGDQSPANGKRSGRGSTVQAGGSGTSTGPLAWRNRKNRGRLGPIKVAPPADGLVRVTGVVVDAASGKPVSDVEVVFADGQSEATTQSDLAGRYSIDVRPGHYRPFVRADGLISVGHPPRERLPGRPRTDQIAASRLEVAPDLAVYSNLSGADLEVVRAGVIAGRVFDRDGHPIAGALVRASPTDGAELRPVLGTDVAETDLDGTFKLELAEAHYVVEAFHDRYGATQDAPTIALAAGDTATADLTMIAGCVIAGRVVRAGGGELGDGALERGYSSDPGASYYPAGTFDEDGGTFRWTTTEEGEITLRAWPWKAPPSPSRTFDCKDGARYDDVVFMVPATGADLGGTIVTARGTPASRAFIDVQGMSEGTMNQQERADDSGNWEVFALPPGQYLVTAYVDGEGATSAVVTSPGTGNRLQLSGTGSLIGRATGVTDGTFTLSLESCETEHGTVFPRTRHLVTVQGGGYRLDGLPSCTLRVEAENRARRRSFEVTIEAGGVATVDLDLAPPKPKVVRGVVRDQDGRPVEGAAVTPIGQDIDGAGAGTTTDASGRFQLEVHGGDVIIFGHPSGTSELMVSDDDPDQRDVEITLMPGDW